MMSIILNIELKFNIMKKYHFFWGGIYSNWYKSPFKIDIRINKQLKNEKRNQNEIRNY